MGRGTKGLAALPALPKRAELSVMDAAEAEDMLALLRAIRARLAEAMDDEATQRHALGALASKLIEVQSLIDDLTGSRGEGGGGVVADVTFDPQAV